MGRCQGLCPVAGATPRDFFKTEKKAGVAVGDDIRTVYVSNGQVCRLKTIKAAQVVGPAVEVGEAPDPFGMGQRAWAAEWQDTAAGAKIVTGRARAAWAEREVG